MGNSPQEPNSRDERLELLIRIHSVKSTNPNSTAHQREMAKATAEALIELRSRRASQPTSRSRANLTIPLLGTVSCNSANT
jgi:hypothetical protein